MKKFIVVLLILILVAALAGCNMQIIDTTYKYNKAILTLPNGDIIEGRVDSWKDYDDGDQIQVKIYGTTYLVHSSDIVLIAE